MFKETREPTIQESQTSGESIEDRFETISEKDLEMYQIPGYEMITRHALERYLSDRSQDDSIRGDIGQQDEAEILKERLYTETEGNRAKLIEEALNSSTPRIQVAGAKAIWNAPTEDMPALIFLALKLDNAEARTIAANKIYAAPDEAMAGLIIAAFESGDVNVQIIATDTVRKVPKTERADLARIGLTSKYPSVRAAMAEKAVAIVPDNVREGLRCDIARIAEAGLNSSDPQEQICAAEMVFWSGPAETKSRLEEKITQIAETGMTSSDPAVVLRSVEMIEFVPVNRRPYLVDLGLASADPKVRFAASIAIRHIPHRIEMIKKALNSGDPFIQKAATRIISDISLGNSLEELVKLAKEKVPNFLVEPPLYNRTNFFGEKFGRQDFTKSGSKTVLIDGSLKDKVIVRQIRPEAFVGWQSAYENYDFWRGEGFDYVPIEPILSFKHSARGVVDIYTGVLDLSLAQWEKLRGDYLEELTRDKDKIMFSLSKIGVAHGHLHDNNFCLRFFRDQHGRVDFSKKPRIYAIDFDQAKSPQAN